MIPDRLTATLILAAIIGAGILIAGIVLGIRWLAHGGKHLDGLGPIGQPAPFEDEIGGEQAERLIPPGEQPAARRYCIWCDPQSRCTDPARCGCRDSGGHCGYDWCTAPRETVRHG